MFYVKYRPGKTILRLFHVKGLVRHKRFFNLLLAPWFLWFSLSLFLLFSSEDRSVCADCETGPVYRSSKWSSEEYLGMAEVPVAKTGLGLSNIGGRGP